MKLASSAPGRDGQPQAEKTLNPAVATAKPPQRIGKCTVGPLPDRNRHDFSSPYDPLILT